jgi:hypothetical protein
VKERGNDFPAAATHRPFRSSLPGTGEEPVAPAFDGIRTVMLRGPDVAFPFQAPIEDHVKARYPDVEQFSGP